MEGSCRVGEFDHMSIEELRDFCDQQMLEHIAEFNGKASEFIASIELEKDWSLKDFVASSCQHHLADMQKRGLQILSDDLIHYV
jgi:hypothetical protein